MVPLMVRGEENDGAKNVFRKGKKQPIA